jgi:hypothetical protein
MAYGGCGNLSILDRLISTCHVFPDDFFVVGWTFIDRFDYSDPMGRHFNNGTNEYKTISPGTRNKISEMYYREIHSEYRDKLTALIYIKTAIDMLNQQGCKFMMTAIDDLLWCDQWHANSIIKGLQQYTRPYIHDFEGRNFLEWSQHRQFAISEDGHPLEQAHAAAAEIMVPKIDTILRKA